MKKILSIMLAASIVFLSGCSAVFAPKGGLIEITGLEEHTQYISTAVKGEKHWVLLAGVFIPDEEESETPSEAEPEADVPEEETEEPEQAEEETSVEEAEQSEQDSEQEEYYEGEEGPAGEFYYTLNLVSPKSGRVLRSKAIKDCPLEDVFGMKPDENGNIMLYDDYHHQKVTYSMDFEQLGEVEKYTAVTAEERFKDNALVTGSFSTYDSFAHNYIEFYGKDRINCFAFPDEKDCLYFADAERFSPSCGDGKRVLGNMIEDDYSTSGKLRVYDFSSNLIVGESQLPSFGKNKTVYFTQGVLQGDSAFVAVEEGDMEEKQNQESPFYAHYYVWNYTTDFQPVAFTSKRMTAQKLKDSNKLFCEEIKNDYGIDVHLNEANEETKNEDEVYALELTAPDYSLYETLTGIRAFFALFPEGFVKESYSNMEHKEIEGFDIFIGERVKGYPSAYANSYGDRYYIALATESFNSETLAHEYMHILDGRLDDYYWEEGIDEMWDQYLPDDFEYMGYEDADESEWDEEAAESFQEYFATRYGMSAATEDRADTFASLFESGAYENQKPEAPYWYESFKVPAKKAVLLCQMLRKAFPSLKNAPAQVWEKSIEKDIKF